MGIAIDLNFILVVQAFISFNELVIIIILFIIIINHLLQQIIIAIIIKEVDFIKDSLLKVYFLYFHFIN